MVLLRSIATVGIFTMMSRFLGFVRDILIAGILGAGPVADAFFVAFKLPNFFRRLFAEGAFSAAFIPLFTRHMSESGRSAARDFAQEVMSVFVVGLLFLVTVLQIAMPWIMHGFAPGFGNDPLRFRLAVEMAQITFPYLLFISLVSQLGGVLNAVGKFAASAAAPIILNLCLIAALLGLSGFVETSGHALAWGVATAGAAQFIWLIVACYRIDFQIRFLRPRLTPRVKRLLVLMLPGAIGAGVVQINLLIDVVIASLLPRGSISFLYYADRVTQLPLGVIGVAVGTALLPLLSRQLRLADDNSAMGSMNRAMEFALLLTLPSAAALMTIPDEIISVLFERGAFGAAETGATAAALAAYSVGLPAYVLIKVLSPGFFAREDTVTPVRIAAICVATNVGLNLFLMGPFLHVGIALATAISAWMNAALLLIILRRRGFLTVDARLRRAFPRIVLASVIMAAIVGLSAEYLTDFAGRDDLLRALSLVTLIVIGLVGFAFAAILFGASRISDFKRMLDRSSR
ncbi:MAG: putative lipid II flippase MurJ [Alphaproteobacteria bacterium MarineAlpha11_Bin1]|nr:MAG: putative lipid II flippase MurJ [Alphaproteobacteria bacterium MarineAlpha11_Bin1]|tara:strand:- start:796 stop:2346 length:1551 start_codon:yes stop_codon:yes gene_type:complete